MSDAPQPPGAPPFPEGAGTPCPRCNGRNPTDGARAFYCMHCGARVDPGAATAAPVWDGAWQPPPAQPAAPPAAWHASPQPPLAAGTFDERFYGRPLAHALPTRPARTWRDTPDNPLRWGGLLIALGILAIFFVNVDFVQRVVVLAPIFEEFLKFGVALVLVTLLGIRNPVARLTVALLPGAAFGVMEHYLTYWDESATFFIERCIFHSGTAALSMATYTAVESAEDVSLRWLATAPSTLIHWLNNSLALAVGVLSLFVPVHEDVLVFFAVFGISSHVLAWGATLGGGPHLRRLLQRAWGQRAPLPPPRILAPQPAVAAAPAPQAAPAPPAPAPEDAGYIGDTVVPLEAPGRDPGER